MTAGGSEDVVCSLLLHQLSHCFRQTGNLVWRWNCCRCCFKLAAGCSHAESILLSTNMQLSYHHDMFRSGSGSMQPGLTPPHLTGTSTQTVTCRWADLLVRMWSDGGVMEVEWWRWSDSGVMEVEWRRWSDGGGVIVDWWCSDGGGVIVEWWRWSDGGGVIVEWWRWSDSGLMVQWWRWSDGGAMEVEWWRWSDGGGVMVEW